MNIQVKDYERIYEINLEQITQLCGSNFTKKDYLVNSLEKYFSNSKYTSYEERYMDNIVVDNDNVGRKYFDCMVIRCRNDLIGAIKLSKTSIMMKYIKGQINNFEYQIELEQIADRLEKIYCNLNNKLLSSISNIELQYKTEDILSIVSNSVIYGTEERNIEELSNYELMETFINLLNELQNIEPKRIMTIIDNIDHLLKYDEYKIIYRKIDGICNKSDIWFVLSSSIDGYVVIDEEYIKGINIVNDIIFNLPEIEHIHEFIKSNYPCNIEFNNEELYKILRNIIQFIGNSDYEIKIRSNVLLKLINESNCIKNRFEENINVPEKEFLFSK